MKAIRRLAALLGATALLVTAAAGNAHAAAAKFSATTTIGTHNAYEKDKYTYWAQALDSGAALLERDVYVDSLSKRWRVSHSDLFANDNNWEKASTPADLYSKDRNQD